MLEPYVNIENVVISARVNHKIDFRTAAASFPKSLHVATKLCMLIWRKP